jgi:hypothetical protein
MPSYCSLEDAWGENLNVDDKNLSNTRSLIDPRITRDTRQNYNHPNNQRSFNNTNNINNNNNNNNNNNHNNNNNNNNKNNNNNNKVEEDLVQRMTKQNPLKRFEQATNNYFKDISDFEPYYEVDYKRPQCEHKPNNRLFPDEGKPVVVEPTPREYYSRTMAPLQDTTGPANRYFQNKLIQDIKKNGGRQGTVEPKGNYFYINDLGSPLNTMEQNNNNYIQKNNKETQNLQASNLMSTYRTFDKENANKDGYLITPNKNISNTGNANTNTNAKPATNNNNNNKNKNNNNVVESFANMENYINHLEQNNTLLREQINLLQNNMTQTQTDTKTYIFDLLLYIVSGIFIIYILDLLVKMLIKKKTQ